METRPTHISFGRLLAALGWAVLLGSWSGTTAASPVVLDPNLQVRTVVAGLTLPTSMAFLGPTDILVLEKSTGKVQRVINGVVQSSPALDLAVNSASERGLLGIALS